LVKSGVVATPLICNERIAWSRRREQNTLRAGMWAFNSVPWEPDRSLTHCEWDILWRMAFGGLRAETQCRIDQPPRGFAWRGSRVERAVAEAIKEAMPAGTVRTWSQPSPEHYPPDHAARCAAARVTEDGWKRADIAVEVITGEVVTLDVRTVHLQRLSARRSTVDAQVRVIENEKNAKYAAYYTRFRPLVVSLTGAVPETAWGAIKEIARYASRAARPRLEWEKYRWVVDVVQRVAMATVKAVAWEATRELCLQPARTMVRAQAGARGRGAGHPSAWVARAACAA